MKTTSPMKTEPVLTIGAVTAVIGAAVALLVAFGVDVTADQVKAILAFVVTAGPIVAALLARSTVDSPLTVQKKVTAAARPKHVPPAKAGK